jgi:peptide/nickel transport system substrate-binding protein
MQVDPKVAWPDADLKENIASVEASGPRTVTFRLKKRSPYALLDINEGHILPRHALSSVAPEAWARTDFSKLLVTNGPFRLAAWRPGQAIELAANSDYYERGLPPLRRVIFRIVTDPGVRLQQLFAGETDVLESVPHEAVGRVMADPSLALVRFDQRMYTYLCWNNRRGMFADPRVRRALTQALDRDEMLRVLARGMGRASAGPIVSSSWAADPELKPLPFDPAAARRLLKEAGWEDRDGDGVIETRSADGARPFRFDIEFNRGNTLRENIALRAAAQLAAVGIRATPRAVEWAAFQKKHRDGDFDAFVASRIVSTRVDLDGFGSGAQQNYAGYADPEVDALVARAAATATIEQARPLWARAQRLIARDQPCTFLFEQDRLYAVRRRIEGVESGPLGLFGGLRKWRLAASPDAAAIR